jgi:uncharacterized protein YprB with RNaseH-like and TPR domain
MYLGWSVGLKGGLKSLEAQLGLSRDTDVKNGYQAVILWQKHLKGSADSLNRLLEYNRADVLNLPLLEEKLEARKVEQEALRRAREAAEDAQPQTNYV